MGGEGDLRERGGEGARDGLISWGEEGEGKASQSRIRQCLAQEGSWEKEEGACKIRFHFKGAGGK